MDGPTANDLHVADAPAMTPPKCKYCGKLEWRHVCGASAVSQKEEVVSHEQVANAMANTYRYRDAEKRRGYQRGLMQLRRALESGRACPWPR